MSDESGTKQRILIVDDSKVIRVTARKILQNHFETVEAVDGEDAWEILGDEEPFSLIVSDLTMPNLDGYGLLERIRSSHLPQLQNIPVIVITGSNDSEVVKERAATAGATDFIGKPFDSVDLLARTQAHASAHTTARTLKEETIALEEQITTDTLTGLANEAAFMDKGYQQLSYAVRHKTSLAVFRVEIDHFGDIYKQHGQAVSESMIKAVATVLQSCIRHEDVAARIGTVRFALLLPGMNKTGINILGDRINKEISARVLKQGETRISFTVSIGVAAPKILQNTRFDELLSAADNRLACAAARGGDQVIHEDTEDETPLPIAEDPCTIEEVTPVAVEETAAGIPEPVENVLELEELVAIEIEDAPDEAVEEVVALDIAELTLESLDEAARFDHQPAVIENLAPSDLESQPASYAGPVPDMTAAAVSSPATDNADPAGNVTALAHSQETVRESTTDPADNDTTSETIIIGVPGNEFMPYEHREESTRPSEATDEDASTEDTASVAANDEPLCPDAVKSDKRPGFFKRLLSGIGSIFRRSENP